ncbi:hypothetical protein L228DRAFT_94077 [Xylona heveae TC161]|uniref:Zn(2)-C6 fungal-type domain-containing protein n=1 Tax=Xylona heveae (strain CBS 132557 / TC161) TaxID=1328760 RepID=A0A161TPW1_XYLHT|nr:hypothetical protein L228DRAFT_94077 [Xylona heveae TC161]KZF24306.1 hypothetical protein L228DRAFT_94077 [Xylona heveae TC161]
MSNRKLPAIPVNEASDDSLHQNLGNLQQSQGKKQKRRNGLRRRGHTKSRKGCKACKIHRIKCDEFKPVCRNCIKFRRDCEFPDSSTLALAINAYGEGHLPGTTDKECSVSSYPALDSTHALTWTANIENDCSIWRSTGISPFPHLALPASPAWHGFAQPDLRHLHHMGLVSSTLELSKTSISAMMATHLPKCLRLSFSFDFVAYSLMAFSASRLAWMTKSIEADNIACLYQNMAYRGLRQAIHSFSRKNADAVLASSLFLSLQCHEWRSWAAVMEGIKSIVTLMQPWKDESDFSDYLDSGAPIRPSLWTELTPQDAHHLIGRSLVSLENFRPCLNGKPEPARAVRELLKFLENLRTCPPGPASSDQYRVLHPLRSWLFWLPSAVVDLSNKDVIVMITLAHFFAVALSVSPIFPKVEQSFLASVRVAAITSIHENLRTTGLFWCRPCRELHDPQRMMAYPMETVATVRRRGARSCDQSQGAKSTNR